MLTTLQSRLLTLAGALALLLVVLNALAFTQNRASQARLAQRQQFIQQTVPLENLYREIVKALAEMATKTNDRQVLDMLSAQGVNVTLTPSATPPPNGRPPGP